MNNDSFADGITAIRLVNGMVRVEYGSLSISDSEMDGSPKVEKAFRIVMTPQGFLKSFSKMERMVNVLIESGVVVDNTKPENRSGPARDHTLSLASDDRRQQQPERRKVSVQYRE